MFHLHIERRKSLRVSTKRSYSFFPTFSYEGLDLEVEDISVTGICFKNFFDQKLLDTHLVITVKWQNLDFECRYQIVEQNSRIMRVMHVEFNPKYTLKLDHSLRPGQVGNLFRKDVVPNSELWKGPIGEKLIFASTKEHFAEFSLFDLELLCTKEGVIAYNENKNGVHKGQKVHGVLLEKVHFVLTNITSPTPAILKLIDFTETQLNMQSNELKSAA
jgi:hypothetical protein